MSSVVWSVLIMSASSLFLSGCFETFEKTDSRDVNMTIEAAECKSLRVQCKGSNVKDHEATNVDPNIGG